MSKNIQLLDCTLRDGGYVNDWKFGHNNLISVFKRLVDSKVDFIEIGFLDDRRPFDIDRSIMPDTKSADNIYGNLDKKTSMVVGMIDYGTCDISNLAPASETFIDAIRIIFKKGKMYDAMEFCRKVKQLGYKVFSQLVSVTSYTDEELVELIKLVNDVKPYAVSMVDTYGLLDNKWLLHIFDILDNNVDKDIRIGFHAHNNFQLAYSNCLVLLDQNSKHDILVDGTLYGMGKSAGNAPLELLAMSLNEKYNKNYNIAPMIEAIDETIIDFYKISPWGYKPFFYLTAKNKCHPSYLSDFEKKENFSISKLDELLGKINPYDKKLLYDKRIGEDLYCEYMNKRYNDSVTINNLTNYIGKNPILLIGPGKNVVLQQTKIKQFIDKSRPFIISINYLPESINVDAVFITKPKRYIDMLQSLDEVNDNCVITIATTNVSCVNGEFDYVFNREPLLEKNENIKDNSFLMFLKLIKNAGYEKVYCAGFDGYSPKDDNYYNSNMEYSFVKNEANNLNAHIKTVIKEYRKQMNIEFVTFSEYDKVDDITGGAF